MKFNRKVGVLYAKTGALGHASLASSYADLLQEHGHAVSLCDVLAQDRGADIRCAVSLHFWALRCAPWGWRGLYSHWASIPGLDWAKDRLLARRFQQTCRWLRETNPSVVITTHSLATVIACYAKARGWIDGRILAAFYNWHVQPFWLCPGVDGYLVVTPQQTEVLVSRGVPRSSIKEVGIPVDAFYYREGNRQEARAELGLADRTPVIFVATGGTGWRITEFVHLVRRMNTPAIVYVAGVPERCKADLGASLRREPSRHLQIHLLGRVDVRLYFAAADLFLTKPAIAVAEALALGVPTVLAYPVPGHDEWAVPEILARTPVVQLPATNPTAFLDELLTALPEWRLHERRTATRQARESPRLVLSAVQSLTEPSYTSAKEA